MSVPARRDERTSKDYLASIKSDEIQNHYTAVVDVDDLLDSTPEIALITARLHQLLGRLDTRESAALISNVRQAWNDFSAAQAVRDDAGVVAAARKLNALLNGQRDDYQVWDDIYRALDVQQKLIGQESKRRVDGARVMKTDDAMGFVLQILHIVKKHVDDPAILKKIQLDAQKAMIDHPEIIRNMGGQGL
jgi:hypothetical protein